MSKLFRFDLIEMFINNFQYTFSLEMHFFSLYRKYFKLHCEINFYIVFYNHIFSAVLWDGKTKDECKGNVQ